MLAATRVDEVEDLRGRSFASAVGVWRVRAGDRSAVLKLLRLNAGPHPKWPSRADPGDPYYWLREPLAYASGVLDPFGVPRLLARVDRPTATSRCGSRTEATRTSSAGRRSCSRQPRAGSAPRSGSCSASTSRGSPTAGCASTSACTSCRSTTACSTGSTGSRRRSVTTTSTPTTSSTPACSSTGPSAASAPSGWTRASSSATALADEKYPADRVDEVFDAVWRAYTEGFGSAGDDVRYGYVQGIRRLRWLVRDRSPAWDATIDFIDGLASDG